MDEASESATLDDNDEFEWSLTLWARDEAMRDRVKGEREVVTTSARGRGDGVAGADEIDCDLTSESSLLVRRSIAGLSSPCARGVGLGTSLATGEAVLDLDLVIPNRISSSSTTGLPSRLGEHSFILCRKPLRLALDRFRSFLATGLGDPVLRHSSKHLSQHGLPVISTIGFLDMSFSQPVQQKQDACQIRPAFSTGFPPSSLTSAYTGLWHPSQMPLEAA